MKSRLSNIPKQNTVYSVPQSRSQYSNNDQKSLSSNNQLKKIQELHEINFQYEQQIKSLDEQIKKLLNENQLFDQQLYDKKIQLDKLESQLQSSESSQHLDNTQEINQWIQQAQNYSGVSEDVINSLLTIEYQGSLDDNQICLSCYQPIQLLALCKYLPCYHLFHAQCINNHLKVNKLCPACSEPVCKQK